MRRQPYGFLGCESRPQDDSETNIGAYASGRWSAAACRAKVLERVVDAQVAASSPHTILRPATTGVRIGNWSEWVIVIGVQAPLPHIAVHVV